VNPEDWEQIEEEIFAPFTFAGRDPDQVTQDVVDEEMALFAAFSGQNRALGG
jgi:hypothetical protein